MSAAEIALGFLASLAVVSLAVVAVAQVRERNGLVSELADLLLKVENRRMVREKRLTAGGTAAAVNAADADVRRTRRRPGPPGQFTQGDIEDLIAAERKRRENGRSGEPVTEVPLDEGETTEPPPDRM